MKNSIQARDNLARRQQWLQAMWRNVSDFMTEERISPPQRSHDTWWDSYGWKAKLYTYLPDVQEARDWLEKVYYK